MNFAFLTAGAEGTAGMASMFIMLGVMVVVMYLSLIHI